MGNSTSDEYGEKIIMMIMQICENEQKIAKSFFCKDHNEKLRHELIKKNY